MIINGLQKLTLLDFPGHTACTVFTGGCNMCCPFCHNAVLVKDVDSQPRVSEDEFFAFLKKRTGLLDGVAVTGGEPTLHPGLFEFLQKVKELGFATKLDTNGSFPETLKKIVNAGLVDYVAMDIKSSPSGYAKTVGVPNFDLAPVRESVEFLKSGTLDYEFRTTVVKELHSADDFREIGSWLQGAPRYFLQLFKDNGELMTDGLHPCYKKEMHAFLDLVKPFVPNAAIRGMDE